MNENNYPFDRINSNNYIGQITIIIAENQSGGVTTFTRFDVNDKADEACKQVARGVLGFVDDLFDDLENGIKPQRQR